MKRIPIVVLFTFLLTSCNGWFFQPSGTNPPTPFLHPTRTPAIVTATPVFPAIATPLAATSTLTVEPPTALPADTVSSEPTATIPVQSVAVEILGCNTSIDITHGLGEVTNAFVSLTNTGTVDLTNLKATLFAQDEGRAHPDKTAQIALLPIAQQVTVKLTVDSTYNADTPIQVEVSSAAGLFQRVGEASCKEIGVFAPDPASLNTPVPANL